MERDAVGGKRAIASCRLVNLITRRRCFDGLMRRRRPSVRPSVAAPQHFSVCCLNWPPPPPLLRCCCCLALSRSFSQCNYETPSPRNIYIETSFIDFIARPNSQTLEAMRDEILSKLSWSPSSLGNCLERFCRIATVSCCCPKCFGRS